MSVTSELIRVDVHESDDKLHAEVKATFKIRGLEYWVKETVDCPIPEGDMRFIVARMQDALETEVAHLIYIKTPNSRYTQ